MHSVHFRRKFSGQFIALEIQDFQLGHFSNPGRDVSHQAIGSQIECFERRRQSPEKFGRNPSRQLVVIEVQLFQEDQIRPRSSTTGRCGWSGMRIVLVPARTTTTTTSGINIAFGGGFVFAWNLPRQSIVTHPELLEGRGLPEFSRQRPGELVVGQVPHFERRNGVAVRVRVRIRSIRGHGHGHPLVGKASRKGIRRQIEAFELAQSRIDRRLALASVPVRARVRARVRVCGRACVLGFECADEVPVDAPRVGIAVVAVAIAIVRVVIRGGAASAASTAAASAAAAGNGGFDGLAPEFVAVVVVVAVGASSRYYY
mmetsp:Transcript_11909/g.25155  ORF Transcript_11909/g.25155 Transcript_11909/m.25155 type:complete len:315 (+) Transcript_11909:1924-2868(+)